jgi:hypothetical protein
MLLPLSMFFGIYTREPPKTFQDTILNYVKIGEELLVKEDIKFLNEFDKALNEWNNYCSKFKKYKFSYFDAVLKIRISCRKAQYYIVQNDYPKTKQVLKDSGVNRESLKSQEVSYNTKHVIDSFKQTLNDSNFSKQGKKEILEEILFLKK